MSQPEAQLSGRSASCAGELRMVCGLSAIAAPSEATAEPCSIWTGEGARPHTGMGFRRNFRAPATFFYMESSELGPG
jgi:hypothetical protein